MSSGENIRQQIPTPPGELLVVFEPDATDRGAAISALAESFPEASVIGTGDLNKFRLAVQSNPTLAVVSCRIPGEDPVELIHELKLREAAPAIIVTTDTDDPKEVSRLYAVGCQKCVVKHDSWLAELGPAARQLFRMQRLVDENTMLVARLTEANAMLEEKNKRLDDFSASLAHDIRGPLGGISMKIDYILDTYNGELPERVKELLNRSYSSVHRLTDVVQSMYEYAKLGKQAAEMHQVDLHQLVQDAIADLHFPDELDITINLSQMPAVWGNAGLLRRVVQNLLINAVKYNNQEKIVISVGVAKTFSNTLGQFAEFFVEDNGPGVPESQRSEIFHMFVRGAGDKRDGLGVGLAIVQRIIELHYGRIWLESPDNGGARFSFVMPLGPVHFIE